MSENVFVGVVAGKKLFFESTGDSEQDEIIQKEITEMFHKLISSVNEDKETEEDE